MNFKTLSLLIVTEKALFAEALTAQFQQTDAYRVTSVAPDELARAPADMLFGLDLVLNLCGFGAEAEILLRRLSYRGPILRLTSDDTQSADPDGLLLPVRYPALIQKIRTLAGSYWFRDAVEITIGPFLLRPAFKELSSGRDAPIALTDKEVEILIYLYRSGGKIVSRDVLLAEIWGYNAEVSTHTLETHIYRLRQKIETQTAVSELLITEAGGYRLETRLGDEAPNGH